jgi:glutamyl/glutaminyl-tRNA synthetase
MKKLSEFPELVSYFQSRPAVDMDLVLKQSSLEVSAVKKVFEQIISAYENLGKWDVQSLEKSGHELLKITKLSPKELFMTIRVAVSGRTATPPLVETMEALGKTEAIARLKAVDRILEDRNS